MPNIQITIDGQAYEHAATNEQAAALNAIWSTEMASLKPGPNQDSNTSPSERPCYIATPAEYLQFVIGDIHAPGMDVAAKMASTLASYAGSAPEPSPDVPETNDQRRTRLTAYALDKRWRVEVGGVTLGGVQVPTDDRAKLLLLGAAQSMADGSSAPLVIAGVNYGSKTKAEFQSINAAVVVHVQSTFPKLATALADIASDTITTTAQIDTLFA
jgi:hypothetical protein